MFGNRRFMVSYKTLFCVMYNSSISGSNSIAGPVQRVFVLPCCARLLVRASGAWRGGGGSGGGGASGGEVREQHG